MAGAENGTLRRGLRNVHAIPGKAAGTQPDLVTDVKCRFTMDTIAIYESPVEAAFIA
jgi:hypothetical protein